MTRLSAIAALTVALSACAKPPEPGPEGERSVTRTPVGPVPGIGDVRPLKNPLPDERQAAVEGRRLFVQYNCSGCHGGRAGGGMGPSLRDEIWIYGNTPDKIFSSIAEGRAHGMPAWGVRIPDQQVWQLVAYIRSLRTDYEPEAPHK